MAKLSLTTFLLLLLPIYCIYSYYFLPQSYDLLLNFTVESRHSVVNSRNSEDSRHVERQGAGQGIFRSVSNNSRSPKFHTSPLVFLSSPPTTVSLPPTFVLVKCLNHQYCTTTARYPKQHLQCFPTIHRPPALTRAPWP